MQQATDERPNPGVLEVITGPMFSGKSEELIRRLKRARIARQRVGCFKPDIDLRYHRTAIASHSEQTHEAAVVTPNASRLREELFDTGLIESVEVVGVDEVQFFDEGILSLTMELVGLGKRVILAGLDTTFANEPFGPVPALMALADRVTKLNAVCMTCGQPAIHTQRLGDSQELVVVAQPGCTRHAAVRTSTRTWINPRPSSSNCPKWSRLRLRRLSPLSPWKSFASRRMTGRG